MNSEGLRLGMFLGGVVMAFFPVLVGGALVFFLLREYRSERGGGRERGSPADAPERS